MTPTQVQDVMNSIGRLFPRSKLTQPELDNFGEQLCRVDIDREQADAIIEQHRNEHDYHSPKLSVLLKKMTAAQQTKRIAANNAVGDRNLLVDVYRRRGGFPSSMSDEDVAVAVAHTVKRDPAWGEDGARMHLREILQEFIKDDVRVWSIVFRHFPHEAMQARVRDLIERTRARNKAMDERKVTA